MLRGTFYKKEFETLSVSKLVEKIQTINNYTIDEIEAVFVPRSCMQRDKFEHLRISVIGLILNQNGKRLALSYGKIVELFGLPINISVSDSKNRQIIPSQPFASLKISTVQSTFTPKSDGQSGKKIAFYPSAIGEFNVNIGKKLLDSKNEYLAEANDADENEDEEMEYL